MKRDIDLLGRKQEALKKRERERERERKRQDVRPNSKIIRSVYRIS